MDAATYQRQAARTLITQPEAPIPDGEIMIIWHAIGLAGEAGEIAEIAKKAIFHRHGLDDAARARLTDEIGDLLWYAAALCTELDADLGAVMAANVAKLRRRYPDGFNSDDSRNRRPPA